MIRELPLPSKRPFGRHLQPPDLIHFCYPDDRAVWFFPFQLEDGTVVAGNGTLTLRLESFIDTTDIPRATARQLEALSRKTPPTTQAEPWQDLDDIRGILYRYHPKPIFERSIAKAHFRRGPGVRIAHGPLVLLSMLQLVARLPRPEVYTGGGLTSPAHFRFNGGTVTAEPVPWLDPGKAFTIFRPREHRPI